MGVWQHLMEYSEQSRSFLLHKWSCRDHIWSFFFPALRLRVSGVCFLVIKAPNIRDWFFQWEFALWSFATFPPVFLKIEWHSFRENGAQCSSFKQTKMTIYCMKLSFSWDSIAQLTLWCKKKNTYDIKITVFNNNGKLKNEDVIKRKII